MAIRTYSRSKEGQLKLSTNFAVREFACKDGSDKVLIDLDLLPALEAIRAEFGQPVTITSGYRTPAYNKGASKSQHMAGCATDIQVAGVKPRDVARYAMTLPGIKGVGLYEYSGSSASRSFTHIDTGKGSAEAGVPARTKPITTWYQDNPNGPEKAMPNLGGGAPATSGRSTVKQGSRGDDVMYLQQRLTTLGYDSGKVDGIFGTNTTAAVKAFQQARKLTADGIVGAKTWAQLE